MLNTHLKFGFKTFSLISILLVSAASRSEAAPPYQCKPCEYWDWSVIYGWVLENRPWGVKVTQDGDPCLICDGNGNTQRVKIAVEVNGPADVQLDEPIYYSTSASGGVGSYDYKWQSNAKDAPGWASSKMDQAHQFVFPSPARPDGWWVKATAEDENGCFKSASMRVNGP